MKWMFGKTAMWLVMTSAAAAVAFSAAREAQLPEGEGKKLVEDICASCHSMETVTREKLDKDGWNTVVLKMVGFGAPLDDKQVPVVVDYLAKNFTASAAGAAQGGSSDAAAAGKKILQDSCTSCHDIDLVQSSKNSKDGWTEVVNNMIAKGAGVSDSDKTILIEYLAKTYGTN